VRQLPSLKGEFRAQWARVNATDAAVTLIDQTILRPAVKAIDEQFQGQPVVDAQLRGVLAKRYMMLVSMTGHSRCWTTL